MIETIYVEQDVLELPLTQGILKRHPDAQVIECQRYGEVFNRKQQNFRLQKNKPALILARKHQQWVLPAPEGYGIGSTHNYYFSHMLNCIYDCRYCFLQGMFRSAHYVLFVNYQDFIKHIELTATELSTQTVHFFSGYDCDSLALEPITGFVKHFISHFKKWPNTLLELRTKSTQIRSLLETDAIDNIVVAYSLSPQEVITALEHKTPCLEKRLHAIAKLQDKGWLIGLRFDPLIATKDFEEIYPKFFQQVFSYINAQQLHSVTLGEFRLPHNFFKAMHALYPDEKLFNSALETHGNTVSYTSSRCSDMRNFCHDKIMQYIEPELYFPIPSSQPC